MRHHHRVPEEGKIASVPDAYRVLCISGGGYRGLYAARLLAHIEADPRFGTGPIGTRFDMIAGTSVGGLIGVALALGIPATNVYDLLKKWGPKIFPKRWFVGTRKLLSKEVYSAEPLEAAIRECLAGSADKKLSEIDKPLLLTTVSWTMGELRFLTSRGLSGTNASTCSILAATRATSAAPAHFPPMMVDNDWCVDGGLAANCPDVHALQRAEQRGLPVRMLSVGTAGVTHRSISSKIPLRGILWAQPALSLSMQAQELNAKQTCIESLKQDYLHLNSSPGVGHEILKGLDVANKNSTDLLTTLANKRFDQLVASPDESLRLRAIVASGSLV